MKLLFLLLTICFSLLTMIGAVCFIGTAGAASLAFVIVPMLLALASLPTYFVLRARAGRLE